MAKSWRLLIQVKHAYVAIFKIPDMSFNAIRENKFPSKISEFTVDRKNLEIVSYELVAEVQNSFK